MEGLETFIMKFNEDTKGVYGISLVNDPAMEGMFVALNNQLEVSLKTIDEEKRIVLGAVLVPDKLIYRNQNGKEFNITFPKETILQASQLYLKNQHQKSSTLEHDVDKQILDVCVVESWIKESDTADKSILYNLSEPIGTWYVAMKIDNNEIWENYIKTGKLKGFSIDGFFDAEKVNLKKDEKMEFNLKSIVEAIKDGFDSLKPKEVEVTLGKVKSEDGTIEMTFEGDTIAKDVAMFISLPDGTSGAVPDGTYPLEDMKTITIVDGLISEVVETTTQEEEIVPATPMATVEPTTAPATSQVKSEKTTTEVFYQLTKEDADFLTQLAIDGTNTKDMQRVATILNALVETNFGWQIREEESKKLREDAIKAYGVGLANEKLELAKTLAMEFGKKLEEVKIELRKEFQEEKEVVQLTKTKPAKEIPFEEMTAFQKRQLTKNK
jgi:hypothetical protein